jgi:hypothetical protein
MGHLDVVPVEAGTESRWKQPPFTGVVADSFVWGRGTLDDKVAAGLMPGVSRQVALIAVVERGRLEPQPRTNRRPFVDAARAHGGWGRERGDHPPRREPDAGSDDPCGKGNAAASGTGNAQARDG